MTAAFIRRLTLTNFRSYHAAQIELARAGPVVLTGANGAGKTNLIEAISLLAPGPRPAPRHHGGTGVFRRRRRLGGHRRDRRHAGPGHARHRHRSAGRRGFRRRRANAASTARASPRPPPSPIICAWCGSRPRWTRCSTARPPSAGAFSTAWCWRSTRSIPAASPRSSARLRSRNRLLEDAHSDPHWLDAVEHETAEVAVAVAAARAETVTRLVGALGAARDDAPEFPRAEIALEGWMEKLLPDAQRDRDRGPLSRAAEGKSRARRRRRPHARRPASVRSRRHPCRQEHSGAPKPRPASRRRC